MIYLRSVLQKKRSTSVCSHAYKYARGCEHRWPDDQKQPTHEAEGLLRGKIACTTLSVLLKICITRSYYCCCVTSFGPLKAPGYRRPARKLPSKKGFCHLVTHPPARLRGCRSIQPFTSGAGTRQKRNNHMKYAADTLKSWGVKDDL